MFCKSCGNRLGPEDTVCAHCGAPAPFASQHPAQPEPNDAHMPQKPVTPETLLTPETTPEKTEEPAVAEETLKAEAFAAAEDAPEAEDPAAEEAPAAPEADASAAEDAVPEEAPAAEETPAVQAASQPKAPAAPQNPPHAPHPARESRKARSSAAWVKALCVLCAVAIVALTAVNAFTDVFQTDNDAVKTVARSALPETGKEGCLEFLSSFAPFYGKTINFEELGHYAFLDLLEPGNANGLYASFYHTPDPVTDKADPAGRFALEGGGWRYYKIPFSELANIASRFDLDLIGCANRADCYFYDGYYYFSALETETGAKRDATLTLNTSKRTEDGSYYLVCETQDGTPVYCLVRLTKEGTTSSWDLLSLSAEPLFTDDGMPVAVQNGGVLTYEMRQRVITAKADDKTEYATYVIDYPYFTDVTDRTATTINTLYGEIIKSYKEKAAEAEESYQRYLRRGYDTDLLPAYTYVISTVTYNKNGHISLLDEVVSYTPEDIAKARKKAQKEAEETGTLAELPPVPLFPSVTYSGVTVDVQTGEILKKDAVFGTDFSRYQDALARVFSETNAVSSDQFEKTGREIYDSTWFLSDDGIRFCYLKGDDYVRFVTLPFSAVDYPF